jgi:putative membrane protein
MFYIVRLFIYNTEANEKSEPAKSILQEQFKLMSTRLWLGITWPSAVLTILFGSYLLYEYPVMATWLWIKLGFVLGLYIYHFTLQRIYSQQQQGVFKWTSQQLRVWNEVATIFLISIVMLVVVKQGMSLVWGLLGLVLLMVVLMAAIRIYKLRRKA